MATAILGAAAWLITLWHRIGEQVTPDDLTITEKVLSASPPGSEWAWLIFFGLLVFFVALSESRRR